MKTEANSLPPFEARGLSKQFGDRSALQEIHLTLREGQVTGLLGRNGAGKTTLLHLAAGLVLPSAGEAFTFGVPVGSLEAAQLQALGLVQQEGRVIEWMKVRQHLEFHASFYPQWDRELEKRLLEALELDPSRRVVQLSPGDRQKVNILLGVCHRPRLLLLDEPMSSLDPIVRVRLLDQLLERLREDGCTVVISSHILNDVEKIVDWIVALDQGRLVENSAFDVLQESFAEWTLSAREGTLPSRFTEPWILSQQVNGRQALLRVRAPGPEAGPRFAAALGAELRSRPLNLDEMFPLLTKAGRKD